MQYRHKTCATSPGPGPIVIYYMSCVLVLEISGVRLGGGRHQKRKRCACAHAYFTRAGPRPAIPALRVHALFMHQHNSITMQREGV